MPRKITERPVLPQLQTQSAPTAQRVVSTDVSPSVEAAGKMLRQLEGLREPGGPGEKIRGMLHRVAAEVPFYGDKPPATRVDVGGGRTEPRIDPEVLAGTSKNRGKTTIARGIRDAVLQHAFRTWADSPRPDVWQTPMGEAVSHYALHRYGLADSVKETRNKIGHAAEVTWSARAVHIEQQARFDKLGLGAVIDEAWQGRMEFAGIMHDVGYMHGGFMHPGKGAADMLANFGTYAANIGKLPANDPSQQVEIEKVAVLAQMHGQCFPWDAIDKDNLLPGDHYIAIDLVLDVVRQNDGFAVLRDTIRAEYADYLKADPLPGQEPKFAWMNDDRELEQLIRAGWILHQGDKFVGPRHKGRALESVARGVDGARNGRTGADLPLETMPELHRFVRGKAIASTIYADRRSPSGAMRGLASKLGDKHRSVHERDRGPPPYAPTLLSMRNKLSASLDRIRGAAKQAVVNEREPGLARDTDLDPPTKARSFADMSNAEARAFVENELAVVDAVAKQAATLPESVRKEVGADEALAAIRSGLEKTLGVVKGAPDLSEIENMTNTGGVEKEFKLAVPNEAKLEQIEATLNGPPKILRQHNVYFDAGGKLSDARWSLRLRIENGAGEMTLKGPKTSGDGAMMVSRPETRSIPVDEKQVEALMNNRLDPFEILDRELAGTPEASYAKAAKKVVGDGKLERQGEIRNERRVYDAKIEGLDLKVEVDRTDYPGHGRFFEIEMEIPASASERQGTAVFDWLKGKIEAQGAPIERAPGKHARLLAFVHGRTLDADA